MNCLPARGAVFSAGAGAGGNRGADGFFSSGGETLGIQDAKITTKTVTWSVKNYKPEKIIQTWITPNSDRNEDVKK